MSSSSRGFGPDGDAVGIARARQRRGVAAVVDAGYLGRREGHHSDLGVVAVDHVEVVKVATCRTHDDHTSLAHHPPSVSRAPAGGASLAPHLMAKARSLAGTGLSGSSPVSRILSWVAIYLGHSLPRASCGQPGGLGRAAL